MVGWYFVEVVVVSGVSVSMVWVVAVEFFDPVVQMGVLSKWFDRLVLVLLEVEVVVHVRS